MEARLKLIAIGSSAGVLALAGLAWLAQGDAIFVNLVNAALAMCM